MTQTSASSSSEAIVLPDGLETATMEDIPSIASFPDEDGLTVIYVFGASGIFSKLMYDTTGDLLIQEVGLYSLGDDGVMAFDYKSCIGVSAICDTLEVDAYMPASLVFALRNDTLLAGADTSEFSPITDTTLTNNPVQLGTASQVVGAWQTVSGDTTTNLDFYADGRYMRSDFISGSSADTNYGIGVYDIQKNRLLLVNSGTCVGSCYTLYVYTATTDGTNLYLSTLSSVMDTLYAHGGLDTSLQLSSLTGATWQGDYPNIDSRTHIFQMTFGTDSLLTLQAYDAGTGATAYSDEGKVDILGPWLLLDFNEGATCGGDGSIGVILNDSFYCFSLLIASASLSGDTLYTDNSALPSIWTR